jgi:hypothetical protein
MYYQFLKIYFFFYMSAVESIYTPVERGIIQGCYKMVAAGLSMSDQSYLCHGTALVVKYVEDENSKSGCWY